MTRATEHGLLMSGPMALAAYRGIKTQTRRPLRPQPKWIPVPAIEEHEKHGFWAWQKSKHNFLDDGGCNFANYCPYGRVGDRVYVREAWTSAYSHGCWGTMFRADGAFVQGKQRHELAKFRGTGPGQPMSCDPCAPLPTISAGGIHVAAVEALLSRHGVAGPVVTVRGEQYRITDIGMRMLEPHELLRAQFGRFAERYDMSAALTKAAKIRLIGNSVCPEVAEALVRANVGLAVRKRVA